MNCRHCNTVLEYNFLDLGFAPPSNAYLVKNDLNKAEVYYPLRIKVCTNCWLVQTEDYAKADELFNAEYAYFSSTSSSWLEHSRLYVQNIITKLGLTSSSHVMELASNDGYLLKNFVSVDIPCLGIEPTESTAQISKQLGIPTLCEFFGTELAQKIVADGKQSDLIIGNNVFAHVPDINDFTLGIKKALKSSGTVTLEFPHLMRLLEHNQFDTVYHEHYSYLSLYTAINIFEKSGLRVYDVEEIPTHGGSLRIYGCHENDTRAVEREVGELLEKEKERGLQNLTVYDGFQEHAQNIKNDLLIFLLNKKKEGKKVMGYGAAAKGNTLLNYCGIKTDLISYVVDANVHKQNKFLPGSHIPIVNESVLKEAQPDFVVIFPWNLRTEICSQLNYIRSWGGQFVTAIPEISVF